MSCRVVVVAPLLLAVGTLGLLASGCGGRTDNRPALAKVSGTITYQGKPLAKASIAFLPDEQNVRYGMGGTDEQGHYQLWTYDPGDGAVVGKHRVAIMLRAPPEQKPNSPPVSEEFLPPGKPLIPENYFNPRTSGLTAEVVAGRRNVINFELVPKN